jgi:peptidoglycan/xylan/chitin deacetylase (PgdA/CDA1 family)
VVEPEAKPGPLPATPTSVEGPTTWMNGATAAYTLIHDDTCDTSMTSHFTIADPELTKRGLRAGFGTIAGMCAASIEELRVYIGNDADTLIKTPQWDKLRVLLEHGHELVNHSWSHLLETGSQGMPVVDESRWKMEIDKGRDVLEANLQVPPSYFIFPFDAFKDVHLEYLHTENYVGVRAGQRANYGEQGNGVNDKNFEDPQRVDFAVFYRNNESLNNMDRVIDDAIASQGWGIREMHGIGDTDSGWEPVPAEKYKAHLDYAKQKSDAGQLWMDTPSSVTRYRFARQHCPQPSTSGDKLSFASPNAECQKYGIALTYNVQVTTSASELVAIQAKKYLVTKSLGGGKFSVHADPTKGDVSFSGR